MGFAQGAELKAPRIIRRANPSFNTKEHIVTTTPSSDVVRIFRLTNEPDGLGLSCAPAGVSLAGVPLLRSTQAGFVPRPAREIAALLKAAYGADRDSSWFHSRLGAIAKALNCDDFALAAIAAVHTRTPELSAEAAIRLSRAEEELNKYSYNPDEPRDWHGRWTRDGAAGPESVAASALEDDRADEPHAFDPRQRVAENASPSGATPLSDAEAGDHAGKPKVSDDSREPTSVEQTFESKYDHLGPVDFAKDVIQFGDWLGREGKNLSAAETAHARAEYSFLQDRLSFWLDYDYKPPTAQGNLLSAALTLYQGAVIGEFVQPGHLPESMVDVAGTASLFGNGPPGRPYKKPAVEEVPGAPLQAPEEVERFGPIVNNSDVKIVWRKAIDKQGEPLEDYLEKENPDLIRLKPKATTFDLFNQISGEAISAKTMNTLSVSYIKKPQRIYGDITDYVNEALDYERLKRSDLDPALIESKSIYLAVLEWTSPIQWRHLIRARIYGEDNGVSVVIIRIRE
jgi:hypothetical protein